MTTVPSRKRTAQKQFDLICLSSDDEDMDDRASVSSAFSTTKLRRGLDLAEEQAEQKPTPFLHQNTSTPLANDGLASIVPTFRSSSAMQRGDFSPIPDLHSIFTPEMRNARREVLEPLGLATPTPGESTSPVEATTSGGPGSDSGIELDIKPPPMNFFPPLNFRSLLRDPTDVIFAKHKRNFGDRAGYELNRPLGCVYEAVTKQWIITDTASNNIRFFDTRTKENGTRLNLQDASDKLRYPSALAVYEAGQKFVVLDEQGIWLYDMRNEQFIRPVIFDPPPYFGYHRGLAVTVDKKLVTATCAGRQSKILMYSANEADKIVAEFNYEANYHNRAPKPSFMDCHGHRIAATDLGSGCFTVYRYSKHNHTRQLRPVVHQQCHPSAADRVEDGKFAFISGVRLDMNAEMWVADARSQTLQWLDRNGHFKSRIRISDSFAYASNFCVNTTDRQLLVCDRRRCLARLYDLESMRGAEPTDLTTLRIS